MKKLEKSSRGFTLIEILIVVAIIGIMTSIAMPNFMKFQCKAKRTEAISLLGGIKHFQGIYYQENGNYLTDQALLLTAGFDFSSIQYNMIILSGPADASTYYAEIKSLWLGPGGQDHWGMNHTGNLVPLNDGCL